MPPWWCWCCHQRAEQLQLQCNCNGNCRQLFETNRLSSPTIASCCDSIASILSTTFFLSGLMATVTALSVQCFCLCVLLSPSQSCCFCSSFCVLAMHPPCRLHGCSTGERVAAHSMIAAECIEGTCTGRPALNSECCKLRLHARATCVRLDAGPALLELCTAKHNRAPGPGQAGAVAGVHAKQRGMQKTCCVRTSDW